MAYPPVQIHNSTKYTAYGTVSYMSIFCRNDDYTVDSAPHTWTAGSRGVCLVTKITASLETPDGNVQATPYTSSGTSYSKFAVLQTGVNSFAVTRLVTATEDDIPADYVEPTEQQN